MKIYRLKLENFKSHKDRELKFGNKNLIIGENGVGKSSIFHAILFSLFGKQALPYINASSISSLIRHGYSNMKVEIELIDNNVKYLIERSANNSGESDARIYRIDNEGKIMLANGVEIVNKKIRELLNIRRIEKFSDVLYIKQGDLGRYILLSGKEELTKKLENMFDIEFYSNIIKVIEGLIRDLEKEKEYLEREKSIIIKDIEMYKEIYGDKNVDELLKEVEKYNELLNKKDKLYKDYINVKTLYSSIDYNLLSQEDFIKNKKEELILEQNKLQEALINLKTELKNLKYEKYSEDLIKKSIEELEEIVKRLEIYKNLNISEISFKIREKEEILRDIKEFKNYENVSYEYEKVINDKNNLIKDNSTLESKLKEILEYIELLKKEINICPICKRELTEDLHKKLLDEYTKEITNIKSKLENNKRKLEEIEKKIKDLEYKHRRYIYIKEKLQSKIKIENIENEEKSIESELNKLKEDLKNYENYKLIEDTINYLKSKKISASISNIETQINNIKKELEDINKKIYKIESMKNNLEKINEIYRKYNYESLSDFERELNNIESEIKKYSNLKPELIKNYKEKTKKYEEITNKIKKIYKNINNLKILLSSLQRYVEKLRENLSKNLSVAFKYYFRKLYRYDDIVDVGIDLSKNRKGEMIFDIYVIKKIDNREIRKTINEAGLSGGQIKILDLALRLSIASLLKLNINTLLLDEPTESLDENNRISLAELLDSLKDYQIILCTHDELFKEKIEGELFEIKRNK